MFETFTRNSLVPLLLRLGLAVIFIYHGTEKVKTEGNEWGWSWAKKSDDPGAPEPPPRPLQFAVAWGELAGGIALAVGLLTRLAAAGIAAIMVGAIITVHGPRGFSLLHGGYEYNFLILVVCAALILGGGGNLAVDRFFRFRRRKAE